MPRTRPGYAIPPRNHAILGGEADRLRGASLATVTSHRGGHLSEKENRVTIERLGQALSEGNLKLFHEQFVPDSVMEYAQSGERIVGENNRRSLYSAFPTLPKVSPQQLRVSGDLGVLEARLDYGDEVDWRAVFVFEFRDGKIAKETAYWTQPFEAPEWRAAWVERTD